MLNHAALAQAPGLRIGDAVDLSIAGRPTRWRLVGVVEEIGSAGVAYVADAAFARAVGTGGRVSLVRAATAVRAGEGPAAILGDVDAAAGWMAAGTVATLAATILPARRAARLVIREALGRI